MHFTSEQRLDDVDERAFTIGEIPGILWTPTSTSAPVPLILLGHPGGLDAMHPRLLDRARRSAMDGFAAASIELPGSGHRPRSVDAEQARADLHLALEAGEPVDEIVEQRISAAGLFAGSFVPAATFDEARRITIPLHVLLQWDDEGNDRQMALDLFDAFGSQEKTLQANMGGHRGVPPFAGEDAARFFARHLGSSRLDMALAPPAVPAGCGQRICRVWAVSQS